MARKPRQPKPKPLAARLLAWRTANRWSQDAAAEALRVPLSTYRKWEQGVATPRGIGLAALEEAIKPEGASCSTKQKPKS